MMKVVLKSSILMVVITLTLLKPVMLLHTLWIAGFVIGIARSMGYNLRWGGDWDMDFNVMDNRFDDFPHFEIRD